jgi:hypothetical protein
VVDKVAPGQLLHRAPTFLTENQRSIKASYLSIATFKVCVEPTSHHISQAGS